MSSKMDRQGVRTPMDIERKYALGDVDTIQPSIEGLKEHVSKTLDEFMADMNSKFEGLSGGYKVTFLIDGVVYRTFTVSPGRTLYAPTEPTSGNRLFWGWEDSDGIATFPYEPKGDTELSAVFVDSYADELYTHFGINKTECPYVVLQYYAVLIRVFFCSELTNNSIKPKKMVYDGISFEDVYEKSTDYTVIIPAIITRYNLTDGVHKPTDFTEEVIPNANVYYWSNKADWSPTNCKGYTNFI